MAKARASLVCGVLALLLSACLSACNDDLPKATRIADMRVLGARTEVSGAPERSTPRPGETARTSFSVVFPSVAQSAAELSSFFITCTAPTRFSGVPTCQEFIDALSDADQNLVEVIEGASAEDLSCEDNEGMQAVFDTIGVACVSGAPTLDVAIEADTKVEAKLVLGVICLKGTPYLDPNAAVAFACKPNPGEDADAVETIAVYGTIPIQHEAEDANENPDVAAAVFTFGGQDWPEIPEADLPSSDDDCASDPLILKSDGRGSAIGISWPASPREQHDEEAESIEISTYATSGEPSRRFTVFAPDHLIEDGRVADALSWSMSRGEIREIGEGGKLVRFYFTVLDRFGGFDQAMRVLCVQR